jgi:hypothetical protein
MRTLPRYWAIVCFFNMESTLYIYGTLKSSSLPTLAESQMKNHVQEAARLRQGWSLDMTASELKRLVPPSISSSLSTQYATSRRSTVPSSTLQLSFSSIPKLCVQLGRSSVFLFSNFHLQSIHLRLPAAASTKTIFPPGLNTLHMIIPRVPNTRI